MLPMSLAVFILSAILTPTTYNNFTMHSTSDRILIVKQLTMTKISDDMILRISAQMAFWFSLKCYKIH